VVGFRARLGVISGAGTSIHPNNAETREKRHLPALLPYPPVPGCDHPCQAGEVRFSEPRPLSASEAAILGVLLSPEFEGVDELRAQAGHAQVIGRCDCGCPTVDLNVTREMAASCALTRNDRTPFEGVATGEDGEPVGDVMLFLADGYLKCLEYVPHGEVPPSDWPPVDQVGLIGPLG